MSPKYKDSGQWRSFLWLMHAALLLTFVKAEIGNSVLLQAKDGVVTHLKNAALVRRMPTLTVEKFVGRIPRLDPLNHFKKYKGGFNVTNLHYWSSLAYTGIWGYTAAVSCLIFGGLSIVWQYYIWAGKVEGTKFGSTSAVLHGTPVFCVIQFSFLLLAASGVVFWGNVRLGHELKATAGILLGTVDRVKSEVDGAISLIPLAEIGPIANQDVAKKFLSACNNLATTFRELTHKVELNKVRVYNIFTSMKVAVSVIASFMVIVVVAGLVSMLRSWNGIFLAVYSLAVFTLVASWLIAGVSFVLASLAIDGCQSMQAYDQNPHNSSIAQLLPCLTPQAAAEALSGAKKAIKIVIRRSNSAVDLLNHQEQKLAMRGVIDHPTLLPHICDPFGPEPEFFPVGCSSAEGSFSHFEDDYGKYRCESDDIEACLASTTPIPNFAFLDALQAMNATKDVYTILPIIFRIITCNFVKMSFEEILMHRCGPLKGSLTVLWISFIIASLTLMPLLVLWVVHGKTFSSDRVTYILRKKAKDLRLPQPC